MEANIYQNGLIYTIKTDNGLYVGSTINFIKRKSKHKNSIYNENVKHYNCKLYKNIRENEGVYSIEIYKLFPCNTNDELRIQEEKIRVELNANLNSKNLSLDSTSFFLTLSCMSSRSWRFTAMSSAAIPIIII